MFLENIGLLADLTSEIAKFKSELVITGVAGLAYVLQELRHRITRKPLEDIPNISESLKAVVTQVDDYRKQFLALKTSLDKVVKDFEEVRAELGKVRSSLETDVRRLNESHEYTMIRMRVDVGRSETGSFEMSPTGDMIMANRALCTLFGLSESEMLGRGWLVSLKSEDRSRVWASLTACITNALPFDDLLEISPRDGREPVSCHVFALPQLNAERKVVLYCGTVAAKPDKPRKMT